MSNRSPNILWPINYSSVTSITHCGNWLLIDDPSTNHRLLYCARKTLFFLSCTIFFVCDSFICVRRIFPRIWSSCRRCRDAKCLSQIQMILNCAICKTEHSWRGIHQGVVQQQTAKRYRRAFWNLTSMCYLSWKEQIWKHLFTFKLF